jgi:hypothetical protein
VSHRPRGPVRDSRRAQSGRSGTPLRARNEARLEGRDQFVDIRDRRRVRAALLEDAQPPCGVVGRPGVDAGVGDWAARVGGGRGDRGRLRGRAPRPRVARGDPETATTTVRMIKTRATRAVTCCRLVVMTRMAWPFGLDRARARCPVWVRPAR